MTSLFLTVRRTLALALFLCAASHVVARAQQAYKIDETDYTRCDLSEVPYVTDLSSPVFVELGRHPDAKVAVVVYAPRPGEAMVYALQIKRWMTEARGVMAERVLAVYGGHAGKRRLELWLIPAGAEPPPDAPPVTRIGVTLFSLYYYFSGESCPDTRLPTLEVFAETLRRLPGWRGTIVLRPHVNRRGARQGDEDYDYSPLTRRRAARGAVEDRRRLFRQLGIDPARIRAVVGPDDSWAHAELWLIPPASATPAGR
ncbi:MAG TPA: hypothetical protein VGP08_01885 [Pyrinomonadaceae bacterium]|jgi:hypothetical protein|nr:hypothetical protein [Pyrinomonadaceae bacterium]